MQRSLLVLCCTLVAGAPASFAADNASSSTPADATASTAEPLAEITVTAQKREQNINDVGITIVAATADQLKSAGVESVYDLPKVTPSFTIGQTFAGYPVFSLRGVNFNAAQLAAPPAVSTYMDEAALPYPPMTSNMLFDVERVEVLKGPQGTLFGQNATGGSINVIAAKPTSQLAAGVSTEVNNFGQTRVDGFVSGPLSDTLRARVAATTTQGGAWQRGYFLSRRENGTANKAAGRILLDWTPTDRITVSANFNAGYDHGEAQQPQLLRMLASAVNNPSPLLRAGYPLPTSSRDSDFDANLNTHKHEHLYQGVLRADVELNDTLTLTSITNYVESKTDTPRDFDGTGVVSIYGAYGGTIRSFVQEARVTGQLPDAHMVYILGANYEHDGITDTVYEPLPTYSGLPPGSIFEDTYDLTNRAAAAFANLDYEVVPDITLTGGVRYTATKQTVAGCFSGNEATASILSFLANSGRADLGLPPTDAYVGGGCLTINDLASAPGGLPDFLPKAADLQQTQNNVSWRAGVNYKPTADTLLYALVSRGYKAGTFPVHNILLESEIHNLGQEQLTAYEVGAKLTMLDRRLHLNVAAFFYDYRDKQFYTYVPVPLVGTGATMVNIPKSDVKGVDADFTLTPVSGLTLRAGGTYIKTRVGGHFSGYDFRGAPVDFSGKEFNYSPPWSVTFDAEYRFSVGSGLQAYLGFGGLYNDRTFSDLGESPDDRLPAYTLLDARVGLESEAGWRAGFWVRNMTDRWYWITNQLGGDTAIRIAGMPRTFGLSAQYRF
jgi:iron complex outermembrane recepter protein